jgi:hypothetical protein
LSTDLDENRFIAVMKNKPSQSNSLFDLSQGVGIAFLINCGMKSGHYASYI